MAGILSIGTRAMFAAQAQIDTAAGNISNANTPGYSRQSVQLETAGGQYTGRGFFGYGVAITTVSRAHDAFLTREAAATLSIASMDSTRLTQLQRLEQVFDMGEAGLGHAASQVLNAFVDVASRPTDSSARQVVLSRLEELASRFRSAAQELATLQSGVTQELKTGIATVNELARRVADLNQQIARVQGLGHEPNDLLDQRDQLIREINKYVQVTQIPADDGTVGLFIGGGQRLVLGNHALELRAVPDEYDASVMRLAVHEGNVDRLLPENTLSGGSLAGLLRFQRTDLADAQNQLGRLALAFSSALNAQHALGLDQAGQPGTALLSTAAPRVLPSSRNTGSALPEVAVSSAHLLAASDYELRYEGGAWQLTRLSDGTSVPYTPGTEFDGLTITVPAGTPAEGDRFLLQPLRQAAGDMRSLLGDPRGIAAASPVIATLPPGNTGTVAVSGLIPAQVDPNLAEPIEITFTSPTTFTVNGTVSGTVPTSLVPGEPIRINGWELTLTGTPQPGDRILVQPATVTPSNNGNALGLLALRDAPLVGQQLVGGVATGGETITDAYASVMAAVGVRVQGAKASAEMSDAIAREAEQARTSVAGVNLDEEAARLIQFQQSYQAAAKVLQIAQTVFDSLLQTVGR
ncbi:flagellar hook-associated protein FlgK [Caldimonas thermodepolymerans]|uniref:flagellar hook-associated protein FlgK n=1 Tax=Caldimonas thermodepolymerans TaxID=215580 RepID=UPI0022369563|nr:flagellar hook-associated protein FlgK [Caldimonas thermodepolymerans]UZG43496.1 flagellar hook-associated protein FlgK [Caldimonas thermodepolymerans]